MAPDVSQQASDGDAAEPTTALTHRGRTKAEFDDILLEQYVNRDLIHTSALVEANRKQQQMLKHMREQEDDYKKVKQQYRQFFPPSRLYGQGYNGYGNGHTDASTRVVYPGGKPRLGHRKAPRLKTKRKDVAAQADQVEELVPIRLDVDWDKIKLRDTFTWNLHDRTVPRDTFVLHLVEDLGLALPAATPVFEQVLNQLNDQLNDFYPPVYIEEDALDPHLPYSAYKNDEMRILIKLNITIGPTTLEDKFEWEINNPLNSPEEFAQSMSRELSLSGEFTTAIAHCIREQTQLFIRSLYVVGHPFDGRPLEDSDLVAAFLPSPLPGTFRPAQQAREYGPYLYELSEADLERSEVIYSREQRRQKRSVNRRGGPTLPDLKDRQRTVRTLVVSSVIPGAAETVEESRIYKRVGGLGRKRGGIGAGDLSDSSESEDSAPESPAMSNLIQGTARTRGMRGAATQAQQRMANIGRSETPEAAILHHHETRTSARRFGGRDVREESVDETKLIVKLKISRERLRKLFRDLKSGNRPANLQQTPSYNRPQSGFGTPVPGTMGPPSTPGVQNQQLATTPAQATPGPLGGQIGRLDAPPPPAPGQPPHQQPPPPAWLTSGIDQLKRQYPNDNFEGTMRYTPVSTDTETPTQAPPQGQPIPPNVKWMWLPRIRCHDCPGKLYTPGPETTVGNFEVHLKNRQHRERVDTRVAAASQGTSGTSYS